MTFIRDLLGGADPYDVAVRVARTFLQAFIGSLIASQLLDLGVDTLEAAAVAAASAVLTVIHGYLAPTRPTTEGDG